MTKKEIAEQIELEKMARIISNWKGRMEYCIYMQKQLEQERKQIEKQLDRLEKKYAPKTRKKEEKKDGEM